MNKEDFFIVVIILGVVLFLSVAFTMQYKDRQHCEQLGGFYMDGHCLKKDLLLKALEQ